jgi:glycosyltransferase involved in cell wall biosynthesis
MQKTVSVCCITYNHVNYIRRCLDSLVNQVADFEYEIVVHDDASTDGTQDIVREYAERYPNLIVPVLETENQYSKGVGSLVSAMLSAATGKYVVEIEGDDHWCDPDKLRLQVEALEVHPECSACVHVTSTVDKDGKPQQMRLPEIDLDHSVISTEEYMRYVLNEGYWMFHLSSCMVLLDLYREYASFMIEGFPAKFYKVGDLPMYLFFSLKGSFYFINRVMTTYTVESGGFMSQAKSDPELALRAQQGFVDGLTAFDEYSDYRFHEYVSKALVSRRFEIDRINRRFDRIIRTPEYRSLIRQRGLVKAVAFYLVGMFMLLFKNRGERR